MSSFYTQKQAYVMQKAFEQLEKKYSIVTSSRL